MQEQNELNDIILKKGGSANKNKKIILAVVTLGVVLIIVVMLMNTLTSNGTDNLPQAVLPPQPKTKAIEEVNNEPLFEDIEVVEEDTQDSNDLDAIAQKLKLESEQEKEIEKEKTVIKSIPKPKPKVEHKKVIVQKVTKHIEKSNKKHKNSIIQKGSYYVQVGSFSKYAPDKKFLKSITDKGYSYKYHTVMRNSKTLNKVLVGPFQTQQEAKDARRVIRKSIEAGAFLVKL